MFCRIPPISKLQQPTKLSNNADRMLKEFLKSRLACVTEAFSYRNAARGSNLAIRWKSISCESQLVIKQMPSAREAKDIIFSRLTCFDKSEISTCLENDIYKLSHNARSWPPLLKGFNTYQQCKGSYPLCTAGHCSAYPPSLWQIEWGLIVPDESFKAETTSEQGRLVYIDCRV